MQSRRYSPSNVTDAATTCRNNKKSVLTQYCSKRIECSNIGQLTAKQTDGYSQTRLNGANRYTFLKRRQPLYFERLLLIRAPFFSLIQIVPIVP